MPQLYSYSRFSSPEQALGGSLERQQKYANDYADKHSLTINEDFVMTDRGLSAFHATHKRKGALGLFLEAVNNNLVPHGSILLIESLDRLSREQPMVAQTTLQELLTSGIVVHTAMDNQTYSLESVTREPFKLVMSLLVMIRAHEESLTKQSRSIGFIHQQLKLFDETGKADVYGAVPFWIDRTEDGFALNVRNTQTVKIIIDLYLKSYGLLAIARDLNGKGIKSPSGNDSWGITTIRSILDNVSLYGAKKLNLNYLKDGKTITEDYFLEDYFPALITLDQYQQISMRKKKKSTSRLGYGEVVHLMTGYGKGRTCCGYCGYGLGSQTQKQKNRKGEYTKTVRRMHCLRHKERGDCTGSFKMDYIEKEFIKHVAEYADLKLMNNEVIHDDSLLRHELEETKIELTNLIETLLMVRDVDLKSQIQRKMNELEDRKESLEQQIDNFISPSVTEDDIETLKQLSKRACEFTNTTERQEFKNILMQSMKSLNVYGRPEDFDNSYHVEVQFNSGKWLGMFISEEKETVCFISDHE